MNAIVQMIVPPPKYMVHRLIPKATYANFATLSRAVIIERGDEYVEALQHQQAVETFVRNAEDAYGFPPYPILAESLSQWDGQDLHPQEQAIVDEALKAIPTIRLRDPKFNWWQRLPIVTNLSMGSRQFAAADD
jgi:dolichol-phosphate mannosyltransferase